MSLDFLPIFQFKELKKFIFSLQILYLVFKFDIYLNKYFLKG